MKSTLPSPAAPLPIMPRIMRRDLVATYLGISTSMLDAEVRAGRFPTPITIMGAVKGWDRHDLDQWIEDRKSQQGAVVNPWDDI
jgi:predicted DNA-binding transcriptional regulator AlpA